MIAFVSIIKFGNNYILKNFIKKARELIYTPSTCMWAEHMYI